MLWSSTSTLGFRYDQMVVWDQETSILRRAILLWQMPVEREVTWYDVWPCVEVLSVCLGLYWMCSILKVINMCAHFVQPWWRRGWRFWYEWSWSAAINHRYSGMFLIFPSHYHLRLSSMSKVQSPDANPEVSAFWFFLFFQNGFVDFTTDVVIIQMFMIVNKWPSCNKWL